MKLLAQHDLGGFGNVGEGMVIQLARDGRRVLWLAHESAPKNVTAVDVTDPRKPSVILQTDLPHPEMRSNSLDLAGDLLVVAYQTKTVGLTPAGFEIFDVADPGQAAIGRVLRRLGLPLARRAPSVVRGRRLRPHRQRRRRLQGAQSQGRPVLPHRGRAAAVAARRGGALVAARHARGRHRAAAGPPRRLRLRLPRPQHQRLPATARPRLGRLSRRRRRHPRHRRPRPPAAGEPLGLPSALPGLHPHAAATARAAG